MQVILLERIGKLGQMGDVVTVKDGYARNYLLPQGKALRATDANREQFEKERSHLEARNLELKKEADGVSKKLDEQSFVAIRQAGDTGQLYGSVSTRDIADLINEAGYSVARDQVQLDKPIKVLGVHPLRVTLHPEVIVTVNVNVARTEEEAKRQARGEDVTVEAGEAREAEEETIAVEEVFEDEALAKLAEEELQTGVEGTAEKEESAAAPEDAAGNVDEDEEASEKAEAGSKRATKKGK
jgi:large subunit ribosomal protein L9